ncbi:MAG: peptide-methionine (S)-S-oxide reductase MsrA [Bdellovibrionales bacterium]
MNTEVAILAAGCFWGVEDLLRKIPGVIDTEVGYIGGEGDPTYENVKKGRSGYAESISITFDPTKLGYEHLLELFFKLHDPTTLNRQGNDIGTQYRSAIFVNSPEQRKTAEAVIARENQSGRWQLPVATSIEEFKSFYSAEDYHQDYLLKNPGGYTCHFWRGGDPS